MKTRSIDARPEDGSGDWRHQPSGYFRFHGNAFVNYQLNRWRALGGGSRKAFFEIGRAHRTFEDFAHAFTALGERADAHSALWEAAFHYRAAEFFTAPDAETKNALYGVFRERFYDAIRAERVERTQLAYGDGAFLPAMRLRADGGAPKGVIVAFGGFDSCMEEFFVFWRLLAGAGYDVIVFEGPGQGGALRLAGLPFDHDWEKPTAAVLDHFGVSDVTLLGLSMGGYWAVRAAAFEPRVARVVAMPPVYDWMALANGFAGSFVSGLMRFEGMMDGFVRLRMRLLPVLRHAVTHTLFITHGERPIDAVKWMLAMNADHVGSGRITQDVLLAGGRRDSFQPVKLMRRQEEALGKARSVTTRVFTRKEQADQHCQIGNLPLAARTVTDWLEGL